LIWITAVKGLTHSPDTRNAETEHSSKENECEYTKVGINLYLFF